MARSIKGVGDAVPGGVGSRYIRTMYRFDVTSRMPDVRPPPVNLPATLRAGCRSPVASGPCRSDPMPSAGPAPWAPGGTIEYRLARLAVVSEYRKGRLARHEVCDAHPELRRAAARGQRADLDGVPDLRGGPRRARHLRLRGPAARLRALHHGQGRAGQAGQGPARSWPATSSRCARPARGTTSPRPSSSARGEPPGPPGRGPRAGGGRARPRRHLAGRPGRAGPGPWPSPTWPRPPSWPSPPPLAASAWRWGSTSLEALAGAQSVLGPAAAVGPRLAPRPARAWPGRLLLLALARRPGPVRLVAIGATVAALVAGAGSGGGVGVRVGRRAWPPPSVAWGLARRDRGPAAPRAGPQAGLGALAAGAGALVALVAQARPPWPPHVDRRDPSGPAWSVAAAAVALAALVASVGGPGAVERGVGAA